MKNRADGFRPKGFFLRKFHYERLEIENHDSGLGEARSVRWMVNGLLGGVAVAAMPFLDWPSDSARIGFGWPQGVGGITFSAAGFVLAGFSIFMMVRRARIKEATDNERVVGRDGDLAP